MKQKTQDLSEWLSGNLEFGSFASILSLFSAGQSHVLVPHVPWGSTREQKAQGKAECCEAGASGAALAQRALSEHPPASLRGNHLAKSECISTRTAKRPFLTPEPATSHISTSFFKLREGVGDFKEAIQAEKGGKNLISTDKTI